MKKVSVCILAYRATYLEETIRAMQAQTYSNITIEVRDDCSPDNIREITDKYAKADERVSYVRNEKNQGEWRTWIDVIKSCDTEYLVTVHDDDELADTLVEKELLALEKHREVAAASGLLQIRGKVMTVQTQDPDSAIFFEPNEHTAYFAKRLANAFSHMAMMMRVSFMKNILNDIEKNSDIMSETAMLMKLNSIYPICVIREVFSYYREHDGQTSRHPVLFDRLNPVEHFGHIYDTAKDCLGKEASRKIHGYTQCLIFQYKVFTAYHDRISGLVRRMSDYLEDTADIYEAVFLVAQLLCLKENPPKAGYKIWGAGHKGKMTKKIIDAEIPSLIFTGYIDKDRTGRLEGHDIVSLDSYCFSGEDYVFVSHNVDNSGFEALGLLIEKGLRMPEDCMLGYGFPHFSLIYGEIENTLRNHKLVLGDE